VGLYPFHVTTYTANVSKHATLTANTVDTVTLASDFNAVEVLNRGTTELYFTVDGSMPTVQGNDTLVLTAGAALSATSPLTTATVVNLISSAATAYSVTGLYT
jgi:hypothetical protein